MSRRLYLVAYDVCQPRRLNRVYRYLSSYKVNGQKSVIEIWVTPAELKHIRLSLKEIMDKTEDRLHIIALDPRQPVSCHGQASHFQQTFFCIV